MQPKSCSHQLSISFSSNLLRHHHHEKEKIHYFSASVNCICKSHHRITNSSILDIYYFHSITFPILQVSASLGSHTHSLTPPPDTDTTSNYSTNCYDPNQRTFFDFVPTTFFFLSVVHLVSLCRSESLFFCLLAASQRQKSCKVLQKRS